MEWRRYRPFGAGASYLKLKAQGSLATVNYGRKSPDNVLLYMKLFVKQDQRLVNQAYVMYATLYKNVTTTTTGL